MPTTRHSRRTVLAGAAMLPLAAAVEIPTALAAASAQYHPDDLWLAKELEHAERAIQQIRTALLLAARVPENFRAGPHCDARCSFTALQLNVDYIRNHWAPQYMAMLRTPQADGL